MNRHKIATGGGNNLHPTYGTGDYYIKESQYATTKHEWTESNALTIKEIEKKEAAGSNEKKKSFTRGHSSNIWKFKKGHPSLLKSRKTDRNIRWKAWNITADENKNQTMWNLIKIV